MNLRKLFLVPAFLSVSFAMAACISEPSSEPSNEPSDEQVISEASKWVDWDMGEVNAYTHFMWSSYGPLA